MIHVVWSAVLTLTILQGVPGPTQRIGDAARKLSSTDVADLERAIASASGTPVKPWLLIGGYFPEGHASVHAYLPEESATAGFRRNTRVLLTRKSKQDAWTAYFPDSNGGFGYAQVAVLGRSLDSITGDRDTNQPFETFGDFQDSQFIAIVTLIRSSPPSSNGGYVPGDWPIRQISRAPDGTVNVTLLREANRDSGISANLIFEGGTWRVTRTWNWVY
jgi:hypothetical protein